MSFQPGLPVGNSLEAVGPETGIWIRATSAATLTQQAPVPAQVDIPLCTGWNLVSYPSADFEALPGALDGIAGQYDSVYAYDARLGASAWQHYGPSSPDWHNNLSGITWGKGYWIEATQDCTLTVEN